MAFICIHQLTGEIRFFKSETLAKIFNEQNTDYDYHGAIEINVARDY